MRTLQLCQVNKTKTYKKEIKLRLLSNETVENERKSTRHAFS